ncbi:MAG: hypothetical protein COA84_06570 [Robiginitomaculum sp.]|nr:MAG: hypothetical protein COA84_06570 [Robiginitomaculum sp.]
MPNTTLAGYAISLVLLLVAPAFAEGCKGVMANGHCYVMLPRDKCALLLMPPGGMECHPGKTHDDGSVNIPQEALLIASDGKGGVVFYYAPEKAVKFKAGSELATIVNRAGDPIPGIDVAPVGATPTEPACLEKGRKVAHKKSNTYCKLKRKVASAETAVDDGGIRFESSADPNGDFTLSLAPRHTPKKFFVGEKGAVEVDVKTIWHGGEKNVTRRGKLTVSDIYRGKLTVVDHLPAGLSAQTGRFTTGAWSCLGGAVTGAGQDVTCTFEGRRNVISGDCIDTAADVEEAELCPKEEDTLTLPVDIASGDQFPKTVKQVRNCARVSRSVIAVREILKDGSDGKRHGRRNAVINGDIKVEDTTFKKKTAIVCDEIRIKRKKSGKHHISLGVGVGGILGGGKKGRTGQEAPRRD